MQHAVSHDSRAEFASNGVTITTSPTVPARLGAPYWPADRVLLLADGLPPEVQAAALGRLLTRRRAVYGTGPSEAGER